MVHTDFVQVAADCYYWFPMPYDLLKPCVLFFLWKIARNYSIVTHKNLVFHCTFCTDWLLPIPFLLLMCLCSDFALVTCSFFAVAFIVYCVYDIFCEGTVQYLIVTSLDLVKRCSTASKGLINNYWGDWVEAETWCFKKEWGIPFWEPGSYNSLIHNRIVPWDGNLHKSSLP